MPDVYKTITTKANLQYYHGKLKKLIDKLGNVKNIEAGSESAYIDTDPMLNVNASIRQGSFRGSLATNIQNNGKTLNYENENYPGVVVFEEKPTDGAMRIASFYSHAAYNREHTIYNKTSVDSKFTAVNGLKFQDVDTSGNGFNSLEKFLDLINYSAQAQMEEDIQHNPSFWINKIALYPKDGELLEYVMVWSKDPDDITNDNQWDNDEWKNYCQWEFLGSTKQDLTGYLKDGDIEPIDNDYIDAIFLASINTPGGYDLDGNLLVSWHDLTRAQSAESGYAMLNVNNSGSNISGRTWSWSAGVTVLILPEDIKTITKLDFSGPSTIQSTDKFSDLLAIVIPHPSLGEPCGIDIMSITDYEQNLITPNLRWIAGDVRNASFVGTEIKTFQI